MAFAVQPEELALLTFQDAYGLERPDCAMLDPGASAFLSGYGPFRKLLEHYEDLGYPTDLIKMTKGRRRFQFGGDASQWSDWSAHLPVFVDGKYGTVEVFLLPGNTPLLCGRPIIEALGMTMDFANKRLKIGGSPWQPATLGRQGEYLWPLTFEHDLIEYDPDKPQFELKTNDPDVHQQDGYFLPDFVKHSFQVHDGHVTKEDQTNRIKGQLLKTMDVHLTNINGMSAYLTQELHRPPRPRVLWEVYCGKARTSEMAAVFGMETRQFSLDTGWNFNSIDHQQQFLTSSMMRCPKNSCSLRFASSGLARSHLAGGHIISKKPWSLLANGTMIGTCASFVRPIFDRSKEDDMPTSSNLVRQSHGRLEPSVIYQVASPTSRNADMELNVSMKTINGDQFSRTRDSSPPRRHAQETMCLQCLHDHQHCRLEGSAHGFGSRTRYMEDFQPGLATSLAGALSIDEPATLWEHAHHTMDYAFAAEEKELTGALVKLSAETKQEAIRVVQRLHRNLGHPSPTTLTELLASRGASEAILQAAQSYKCLACAKYKKPNDAAPAATQKAQNFMRSCKLMCSGSEGAPPSMPS